MSSKVDRAAHGPSWTEVIIGAILSLILGIVAGAILLIIKPVTVAKEVPKDAAPGAVYYVEGIPGNASRANQVLAKRNALIEGQTVKLTEDEINSVIAAGRSAAKPGEKAPDSSSGTFAPGTPNVRIRNSVLQVGVPITLNLLGLQQRIIAQARGGFEKDGDVFTYEPTEMYFGSCPVQRLPFLGSYIRHKLVDADAVPPDVAAAWSKLSSVSLDGNTLVLAAK
jgi:hypothetical protein